MTTATVTSKCANRGKIGKSHDAGVSKFTESILALEPLAGLLEAIADTLAEPLALQAAR
jgi:hypothetical protein